VGLSLMLRSENLQHGGLQIRANSVFDEPDGRNASDSNAGMMMGKCGCLYFAPILPRTPSELQNNWALAWKKLPHAEARVGAEACGNILPGCRFCGFEGVAACV
jgi:hypothetical protein